MTRRTQSELEKQMQGRGYERFLNQLEAARESEGQSNTAHGRELIKANIDSMVVLLEAFIKSQEAVRRKAPAAMLLKDLNLEAVVYLALKTIINSLGHDEAKTTATAINIGMAVSNALTMAELGQDKEKKGLVKHIETSANRALGNDNSKERAVVDTLAFFNMQSSWSVEDQLKVGVTLVNLAAQATLVEEVTVGHGKETFNKLVPTGATVEMIEVLNLCPEFAPVYLPMVTEPKDWDAYGNGGYLELRQPLVKTRFEGHTEALESADLSSVRQSINIIQQTAWSVHTGLLSIAQRAMDEGRNVNCLPYNYDHGFLKRKSVTTSAKAILSLAEEFKEYEAIWFPHNMDWRGRIYPMVDGLSPQGNKLAKSLLSFAEGKRLDDDGENFLAIHIANEFGKDKLSLSDRVEWTLANEARILDVAKNPFGPNMMWWMNNAPKDADGNKPEGADNPWGFLRGCLEWSGYCADPDGFLSTLPVAFDGSCSGLQHYSAMFRDEIGGYEVNLVPGHDRQDIYASVLGSVVRTLNELSNNGDEDAAKWLSSGFLSRTLMKPPTMTYVYASTVAGMTDQIMGEIKDVGGDVFAKDKLRSACRYLAGITFAEIEKTVVKAAEGRDWLKGCVSGKKEAAQWTTPDGLPVVQKYKVRKTKQLDITVGGDRIQPKYNFPTDAVDTRKMASAIAPNVIHSLDATHIRLVAVAASQWQIHSLAMIHDSFGCLAGDAGRFFNIIREQFIELYGTDVAEKLNEELSGGSVELPTMGNLDLDGIIDTDYSFS